LWYNLSLKGCLNPIFGTKKNASDRSTLIIDFFSTLLRAQQATVAWVISKSLTIALAQTAILALLSSKSRCQEKTQGGSDDERKGGKRMKMSDETRCKVQYMTSMDGIYMDPMMR